MPLYMWLCNLATIPKNEKDTNKLFCHLIKNELNKSVLMSIISTTLNTFKLLYNGDWVTDTKGKSTLPQYQ